VRTVEPRAVALGALTAVGIALPVGLVGQAVVESADTSSVVAFVFLVPILMAFVVGGFVAARRAGVGPLSNGALAALGAFAVIQGVGLVRRLASGESVAPASLAFAAFLAYSCGLVGALLAQRLGPRQGTRVEPVDPVPEAPPVTGPPW
jgi:hypothetical protein